jgi:integrase
VTWGKLTNRWLNFFAATHHINEAMCERYMLTRLREVLSQTVVGELSTLTIFIRWLHAQGELPEVVKVPTVPPRSLGTPSKMPGRKAAFAVSPDECRRMIDLLPVMSKGSSNAKPYPVRARFIVAYATSLRPTTLHKLRAGIHHTKGAELVTLTRDVDKARFAREVPLIEEAQKAFDSVYPKEHGGLLFGDHDYRGYVKRAAIKVLGLERGRNFNAAHFRSACITHLLEDTDNVAGAQWMAGHLRMSTTARYVKTSLRAGKAAVEVAEAKRRARAKQRPLKRRAA